MTTPVIYIAGPVSGQPDRNRESFYAADKKLKDAGFITRNPHDFCSDIVSDDPEDPLYYRRGFQILTSECTDIVLLPGWEFSVGATHELNVARICKMKVHKSVEEVIKEYSPV